MEARLKAILELESSQMQKDLIAASNNLKKFERELGKATDPGHITYLQRSIGVLNADITRLTASANGAAKATAAIGGAAKASTMNTMNFARVIQDLPFGFMGIQNNLTQLIPGVGAAGLAFSALTAAITFSSVGLSYWSRGSKEAKASASDLAEYLQSVAKSAGEDITKARLLYQASNNVAIAMDARIRAAKELKELYPSILSNYSAEDIALGKAAKGFDLVTAAILANAKARAAQNKIAELEATIQDRLFNIDKIKGTTDKESKAALPSVVRTVGGKGKAPLQISLKTITIEEKRLTIQNRRNEAIQKELDLIKQLRAQQFFFTQLAGGSTALQQGVIPPPDKPKTGGATSTLKDSALSAMAAMSNDFQSKKGKYWRDAKTERGNDLSATPDIKVRIEDNAALNRVLIEQSEIQTKLNEQLAGAAEIAEYGGQVFGQMVAAMMNGESIGDVLANAFKQIAVQIAAAVAQALIFAALLEAFPALKGVFASVGAVGSIGQSAGNAIGGAIRGQDIQLSQRRTSTAMGFRRGRR